MASTTKKKAHVFFFVYNRTKKIPISEMPVEIRFKFGGAYRDRTDDPLRARQVLSQLS